MQFNFCIQLTIQPNLDRLSHTPGAGLQHSMHSTVSAMPLPSYTAALCIAVAVVRVTGVTRVHVSVYTGAAAQGRRFKIGWTGHPFLPLDPTALQLSTRLYHITGAASLYTLRPPFPDALLHASQWQRDRVASLLVASSDSHRLAHDETAQQIALF